jgi:methylenetetrahydrofolate reductase (NADPH)
VDVARSGHPRLLRLDGMSDDRVPSIADLIRQGERSISFEFMPPRDEAGAEQLWTALRELEPFAPTFVSVTYGAGGTTRDTTVQLTGRIARETSLVPMGHLTCVGHTRAELDRILDDYAAAGVHNVLALRGDPKDGPRAEWTPTEGGFSYASELVALADARATFTVGVAAFPGGHPGAESVERDTEVLLEKQRAGATFAITDMVFRAADYAELVERAAVAGVDIPILPGIMPILNLGQVSRMAELSGREIPEDVRTRVEQHSDDPAALRAEGIAMAAELCEELLDGGAPGLHFYTLNRSKATRQIFEALRITV